MTSPHICPPDHPHGANNTCRADHGCKCVPCTGYGREYEFWRQGQLRAGRALRVDAIGSIRRIRALQRLGWSRSVIAEHAGMSEGWVYTIARRKYVSPATAAKIRAVYDTLSMQVPPASYSSTRARLHAEARGWPAPLAWDEESIDLPNGRVDYDARRRMA